MSRDRIAFSIEKEFVFYLSLFPGRGGILCRENNNCPFAESVVGRGRVIFRRDSPHDFPNDDISFRFEKKDEEEKGFLRASKVGCYLVGIP